MPREERSSTRRPGQLPPGRHKLPREFVTESQRTRIMDAVIEAVAELGYQGTRLSDVMAIAGVSRKTFYEHFKDIEDAFLAAYDLHVAALTEAVSDAFLGTGGGAGAEAARGARRRGWPDQVRDGVRAFLGYLVDHPAAAKVCLVDALGAGRQARARRDTALRSFTFFVDSGRADAAHEVPGRTALAVLGGANELIAWEMLHGSPRRIGALAPEIVYMIVLPFVGPRKALAERAKALAELGSGSGAGAAPGTTGPGAAARKTAEAKRAGGSGRGARKRSA